MVIQKNFMKDRIKMQYMFFLTVLISAVNLNAQVYVGQSVPDVTETDCNGQTERIYDVLASGKPLLVFKTDMICSNTTAWGITVRQYADLYASQYRTWVCADFIEANSPSEQCQYMQQYEQQTGLNTNSVFRFIDTTSVGPYDPNSRGALDILCYQGYIVIGLDSTVIYVGNDINAAVTAALNASQTTGIEKTPFEFYFNLFPNPANTTLQLIHDNGIETIQVFNLAGQLVIQKQPGYLNSTIDISMLENGVYFLVVKNKEGLVVSEKFVKQ